MSELSPFARAYAEYLERGFSVLPIAPGKKYPGEYDGHRWSPANGWNKYVERYMTEAEIDAALTWPDAGIGIALGKLSGIVALDWDYDGGVRHLLEPLFPPSPCKKVGSKGYTAFYRYNGEIARRWTVGGERVLDFLSDGTQTVLPPSIHPGTGQPYYWDTPEGLDSIDLDELPQIPAGTFERADRILEPYKATTSSGGSGDPGKETTAFTLDEEQISELLEALAYIPADDYDVWVKIGMSLKTIGERGFVIWDNWSQRSSKYDRQASEGLRSKWDGFKVYEAGVSYKTIFKLAISNGWANEPGEMPAAIVAPGPLGNMARAALEHAIRIGTLPPTEGVEPLAPPEKIRTGLGVLWDDDPEFDRLVPTDWLIEGIQISDSLAMTYGPAGGGKTFHVLDKALHVAAGLEFHGRPVKRGKVVYICGEGRVGIAKRVRAWKKKHDLEGQGIGFAITTAAVPFLESNALDELAEVLRNFDENPILIVIDTLNRNFGDGDENATKDMSAFVAALDSIRILTGACIEVVHHTGKGESGTARGNSALRAALDSEFAVKPVEGGLKVSCTKQKDAEQFDPIPFTFETIELGAPDGKPIESLVCVLDGNALEIEARTDAMLKNGLEKEDSHLDRCRKKVATIARDLRHANQYAPALELTTSELREKFIESTGCSRQKSYEHMNKLVDEGLLSKRGKRVVIDEEKAFGVKT